MTREESERDGQPGMLPACPPNRIVDLFAETFKSFAALVRPTNSCRDWTFEIRAPAATLLNRSLGSKAFSDNPSHLLGLKHQVPTDQYAGDAAGFVVASERPVTASQDAGDFFD